MERKVTSILITAAPGVGKTTMVKRLIKMFREVHINCNGFYTEEVRLADGRRIGFDVVDTEGKRSILARKNPTDPTIQRPQVGKYFVYTKEFEEVAVPNLKIEPNTILIVDEIGKMEFLSPKFKQLIQEVFGKTIILATIPKQQSIDIIENMKSHPNSLIFEITRLTRNRMVDEVFQKAMQMIEKK